jgi:hypothetical protein
MSRPPSRRAAAFVPLVLLAIAWSSAAPCASSAQAVANMSLADFARYVEGREFYGAYLFGRKVGWVSEESRLTEHQGSPVLENAVELHLEAQVAGKRTSTILRETVRFALEGEGSIVSIESVETDDDSQVQRTAIREGDMLRITSREKRSGTATMSSSGWPGRRRRARASGPGARSSARNRSTQRKPSSSSNPNRWSGVACQSGPAAYGYTSGVPTSLP